MTYRASVAISVGCCIVCIGLGILFGYLIMRYLPQDEDCAKKNTTSATDNGGNNMKECKEKMKVEKSCDRKLPRTYVAYHLGGEKINVDGTLGEKAWNDIDYTDTFVDLRGMNYPEPEPEFNTRAKIRWDDNYLYVAAFLNEKNLWALQTKHESPVWQDNAFEIYVDPDGSTHNYKEMQINALGTTWDLMLTKAYMDNGKAVSSWSSNMATAVFPYISVNDPTDEDKYWSVEMKFPFENLKYKTMRTTATPDDDEIWRIVLARPQWQHYIVNGSYIKNTTAPAKWWSWNPHGVTNLHLPDRWGFLQFSRAAPKKSKFKMSKHMKLERALFDVYNSMRSYNALLGGITDDLKLLDLPLYLRAGDCYKLPVIELRPAINVSYLVTLTTLGDNPETGYVRHDRKVWYGDRSKGLW